MKKLLWLLLVWLYPLLSFGAINESLTDVYYANGMQVNEGNATVSTILLKRSIQKDRYNLDYQEYLKHIGKVTESYNSTHGLFPDFFESFMQKLDLQSLIDWYALLKGYVTSHLENSRIKIMKAIKVKLDALKEVSSQIEGIDSYLVDVLPVCELS